MEDDFGDAGAPPSPIKITAMEVEDGPLPPMPPGASSGNNVPNGH